MSEQVYYWKEGDAHKVGRKVLLGGSPHKVGKATLMQEWHTMRLAFVPTADLSTYPSSPIPEPEVRT
jgi:hypothetical protein